MASDLHGFTEQETLNKVLNTSNDSLQVDIVDATGVTITTSTESVYVDDADWTDSTSSHTLVGGLYQSTPQTITDGDTGPLQVNANGNLIVDLSATDNAVLDAMVVDLAAMEVDLAAIEVLLTAANVDHAANEVLLGTIDSDTDAIKTAVQIIDNAVHVDDAAFTLGTHSGTMMMGFAGTQSVNANDAGAIAMETDGSIHIHDGGNTITVDGTVTANLGTTDNAVLDAIAASLALLDNSIASGSELQVDVVGALPAGSAAIGKLAANSGVDIGDVDVTSIVPGTGATNLGKAEDAAHSDGDTGVMALAVRNDDVAALSGADGDYSPLQVNAAGSLYTKDETGEAGSILVTGTTAVTTTVTANTAFVAIQFIEDSVFDSGNDGLVSSTNQLYPSTQYASTSIDADGGAVADSVTFPQGLTIFGRWSGFKLASGKVIAYIAHV
jgi:hypothetical protein